MVDPPSPERDMIPPPPDLIIQSDASLQGRVGQYFNKSPLLHKQVLAIALSHAFCLAILSHRQYLSHFTIIIAFII